MDFVNNAGIGSFKAGSKTEFKFCTSDRVSCMVSAGPWDDPLADVDSSRDFIELSYKNY